MRVLPEGFKNIPNLFAFAVPVSPGNLFAVFVDSFVPLLAALVPRRPETILFSVLVPPEGPHLSRIIGRLYPSAVWLRLVDLDQSGLNDLFKKLLSATLDPCVILVGLAELSRASARKSYP